MDTSLIDGILNDSTLRCLYLASLISADTVTDEESARNSIKKLEELESFISVCNLSDDIKEEVSDFVQRGLAIVERDLESFTKEKVESNE